MALEFRRVRLGILLGASVLFGQASPLLSQGGEPGLLFHPSSEKIPPRLSRDLAHASPRDTFCLWAFFTDRGLSGEEMDRALALAETRLDPHTRWRRLLRGHGPLVTEKDLPLPESYVAELEEVGAELRAKSRWLCAVSFLADAEAAYRVAGLPFVERIRPVGRAPREFELPSSGARRIYPSPLPHLDGAPPGGALTTIDYGLSWGQLNQIQVPALHEAGYRGAGVRVGMLDTGFNLAHEAFASLNVIAEWDFVNDDGVTANEADDNDHPWQHYHGTLTLSLLGACRPGIMLGPAFEADFILAKTELALDEPRSDEDGWVMGIEWAESLGAEIISSSLGYFRFDEPDTDYTYEDMDGDTAVSTVAADEAARLGVVVVNCLGNNGLREYRKMLAPSDGDSVLGIGAVDSNGVRTPYSSIGPTYDGRLKPDLLARGDIDVAAWAEGDTLGYTTDTGTSCATPLAAGVAVLLLQAHPEWGPMELANMMRATATRGSEPDTLEGWGIIRGYDALMFAPVREDEIIAAQKTVLTVRSFPNPFRESVDIVFGLTGARKRPDAGPAGGAAGTMSFYDVRGRLVDEFPVSLPLPGEAASLSWDAQDAKGNALSPGIFLVRLEAGGHTASAKLLRVP